MNRALVVILALVLSLGIFSYFAEVKYVSKDNTFSIGKIGVQFAREGKLYQMPPPPYKNQIASIVSTLAWYRGGGSPISPVTVATSNVPWGCYGPSYEASINVNHPLFYYNGYFYVIFGDSGSIKYASSQDGTTWSSPQTLVSIRSNTMFDSYFNGTYLYLAWYDTDPNFPQYVRTYFMRASVSDGVITPGSIYEVTSAGKDIPYGISVTASKPSGRPYVSCVYRDLSLIHI